MSLPDGLFTRKLNQEDENDVCELLEKFYTIDNTCLKLVEGVKKEEVIIRNNLRVKQRLQQPYSVGVFEIASNKLVAITMGQVKKKYSTSQEGENERVFSEAFKSYLRFLAELESGIFEQLKVDEVFEMGMGLTHKNYKNMGLNMLTTKLCYRLSKQSGCKYIITKPTTEYICKNIEKHGDRRSIFKQIMFSDYVDPTTGRNPFVSIKFPFLRGMLICSKIDPREDPPVLRALM